MSSPRVLHLNDCAFVGQHLVAAGHRAGLPWRILPPTKTWPPLRPGHAAPSRFASARTLARVATHVAAADVVHVHFATTVRRLSSPIVPRRPYVLHLHGTDIRTLWAQPLTHPNIQRYVDGAAHVYYSTLDNRESATAARADAEYMPIFVDSADLPTWNPQGYAMFASRWEEVKGLEGMLEVARGLISAGVEVRGLDWGPGADRARDAGVALMPKTDHPGFLGYLAGADVVIGQSTSILSVSEIEAMAIGVPLAATGEHLPGPDGAPVPILGGSVSDVVEAAVAASREPAATARSLGSREWTLTHHTADAQVAPLLARYRSITER